MATVLWGWHTNGSFAAAVCYGAKLRAKKSGKHKEVVIFSTTKKLHSGQFSYKDCTFTWGPDHLESIIVTRVDKVY